MQAHSLGVGDSFDEVVEELTAIVLTALLRVFALTLQDSHELRTRLEEPAPFADTLEGATQPGRAACSDRWQAVDRGRSPAASTEFIIMR
jgi:hypothetical protein